ASIRERIWHMSELTKEHGSKISTAYFVSGGREKPRSEFIESGKVAAPLIYEDEQDQRDFLKGWEDAWESNTLTFELLTQDDPILAECTRLADRRVLVVERQTFRRARLGIGAKDGMWDGGYDDVWDYESPESALN